jgi:zinc/manganese transport system substrate-binding protein
LAILPAVFSGLLPGRRVPPLAAAVGVIAVAFVAAGCGSQAAGPTTAPDGTPVIPVVATTTQLGDIVRAVGGEGVDVHQILRPNTDPHEYEPRPDDVKKTAGARVIFESGDNLDRWMKDVAQQAGSDADTVDLGATAPVRRPGETSGPEASKVDPHWWHDPVNVEAAVPVIAGALSRANPGGRATYARNGAAYLLRLRGLDARIRTCMRAVPAARRRLVTDHDAFGYFAQRYGIDVVGAVIPSQTTTAQPSAGDLASLVRTIRRERVRAIFPESSVNPKLAEAIARDTGARSDLSLYGDTLGPKGSSGDTYLDMEQANANAMVEGFTGGRSHCR